MSRQYKVLFVGPRPKQLQALRSKEEVRASLYRVAQMGHSLDLIEVWGAAFTDLPGLLLKHQPDIVHISAHGSEQGYVAFEDDLGQTDAVTFESVAKLIRAYTDRRKLFCILLNGCYMNILAEKLKDTADYIIASSHELLNDEAIAFSQIFYQQFAAGEPASAAFKMASSMLKKSEYEIHISIHVKITEDEPMSKLLIFINALDKDPDIKYLNEIKKRLKINKDHSEVWDKSMIPAGSVYETVVRKKLDEAQLIILLVSADALADDEWLKHTKWAIEHMEKRKITVVPLIIRAVSLTGTGLEKLTRLPPGSKAMSSYSSSQRDAKWIVVMNRILELLPKT